MKYLFILIIIILILLLYFHNRNSIIVKNYNDYSLNEDGFNFMPGLLSMAKVNEIKNLLSKKNYLLVKDDITKDQCLSSKLLTQLGPGYIFQNYMLVIKKSAIHTCHRDSNGTLFNPDLKYTTFTLLIFLEKMERSLGVIPKSHKNFSDNFINFTNNTISFSSNPGDALLFNSNLYHVGEINNRPDNLRLQFKICHFEDEKHISYYNNYFKILNQNNNYAKFIQKIQKNFTCFIPGISNFSQDQIQTDSNQEGQSEISKLFSKIMYGNSNFYNLETIKGIV